MDKDKKEILQDNVIEHILDCIDKSNYTLTTTEWYNEHIPNSVSGGKPKKNVFIHVYDDDMSLNYYIKFDYVEYDLTFKNTKTFGIIGFHSKTPHNKYDFDIEQNKDKTIKFLKELFNKVGKSTIVMSDILAWERFMKIKKVKKLIR